MHLAGGHCGDGEVGHICDAGQGLPSAPQMGAAGRASGCWQHVGFATAQCQALLCGTHEESSSGSPEAQRLNCVQVFKLAQLAGGVALTQDAQVLLLRTHPGQGRGEGADAPLSFLFWVRPVPASSSGRQVSARYTSHAPAWTTEPAVGAANSTSAAERPRTRMPCPLSWICSSALPPSLAVTLQRIQAGQGRHNAGTVTGAAPGTADEHEASWRVGRQHRRRGVAHMICVAPASRLFSSISFRALEGRCSVSLGRRGWGAAAPAASAGGGRCRTE